MSYIYFAETVHNGNLNIFRPGLDNFEKTFYRKFYRLLSAHIVFVVLLEKLPNSFRRTSNSIRLADS